MPAAILRTSVSQLPISVTLSLNSVFKRETQMSTSAPISCNIGILITVPGGRGRTGLRKVSGFSGTNKVTWMYPFHGGGGNGFSEMGVDVGKAP